MKDLEKLDFNIFLIGFMGVGKSTVSKALQRMFAMDVVEMDEIIAKRNGMSISEIFELHGEEYFRNEETAFLRESREKKNMIVSCGGGVPMRQVNVDEMKKSGKVVLLTANPETILEHVKHSHDRPLLECLSQPLFRAYQMGQPFNENDLRPCPMLENPEALQKIVHATDAKSTDMQSPESVESLCGKCEAYAKCWAPEAEKLKEANPKQISREKGILPEA